MCTQTRSCGCEFYRACPTYSETSIQFKTSLAQILVGWHNPFNEFAGGTGCGCAPVDDWSTVVSAWCATSEIALDLKT